MRSPWLILPRGETPVAGTKIFTKIPHVTPRDLSLRQVATYQSAHRKTATLVMSSFSLTFCCFSLLSCFLSSNFRINYHPNDQYFFAVMCWVLCSYITDTQCTFEANHLRAQVIAIIPREIGHFRVRKSQLVFKMRLSAKPFNWKWVLFECK